MTTHTPLSSPLTVFASVDRRLRSMRSRARGRPRSLTRGSQAGFVLVELLVACGAATVVLTATLALLFSGQQVQTRDAAWAQTLQEGRVGLARMLRDIRQAYKVEEAKAGAILFLATIGAKTWRIKYECGVAQTGTEYTECVRFAAEGE